MVTMSDDIEEEYLTCYICYDVFTEPKTLTCLHRFCERCLQNYLIGQEDLARKKKFPCPVCREMCPAPNPRRPPADWAGLLKTDFHLKNLIKALQAQNDRQKGRSKADVVNPCGVHADKEQDLYCVDCGASICHLCAGLSHRRCSNVITLTDAAADRRATFDLKQRELSTHLRHVRQLRQNIQSAMEDVTSQKQKAEETIREASSAAIAVVRRQETEQVEELAKRFETVRGAVAKRLAAMDQQVTVFEQVLETAAARVASASDLDIVKSLSSLLGDEALDVDMIKVKAFVNRLQSVRLEFTPLRSFKISLGEVVLRVDEEEHLIPQEHPSHPKHPRPPKHPSTPEHPRPPKHPSIAEHPSPPEHPSSTKTTPTIASATVNTTTITATFTKTPPRVRPPVPPKRPRSQTLATMETNVDGDPVRLRTIPGKFREDQLAPKLRDVVVMGTADKVVLVTDWANQCVKAFHRWRERDCRMELGGKPWCLARIADDQVAVSLPVSRQICLLKVLPRLALQSSFFAEKRYSGLAALSPETLLASGGSDPPSVDIISLGGEVLRSFSNDETTGRDLFSYPSYITVAPNKNQFIVSDRRTCALICMDTFGHVVFNFRPDGCRGLREPSGVRTDAFGRVYVAESRGVVRLTPQGVLDRPLLRARNGVEVPKGLALDEEGLLYVTTREEDIVVFRIS